MIIQKTSDDKMKNHLMCQNPASVPHVLRKLVNVGSQDSHAVYSVGVQIMRINDVNIPTIEIFPMIEIEIIYRGGSFQCNYSLKNLANTPSI